MKLKQITRDELLGLLDPEIHESVLGMPKRFPDGEAVVLFENMTMDSSQFGARTVCIVGPGRGIPSVAECETGKAWLNDLPSRREYPQAFIPLGELTPAPI